MNNTRLSAVVRPTRRWQSFRPVEARHEPAGHQPTTGHQREDKKPRRTLTVVFRVR